MKAAGNKNRSSLRNSLMWIKIEGYQPKRNELKRHLISPQALFSKSVSTGESLITFLQYTLLNNMRLRIESNL